MALIRRRSSTPGELRASYNAAIQECKVRLNRPCVFGTGTEGQAYACMEHNVVYDLPKIECPALVIVGEDDIFVPQWLAREVANGISNSDIHLYPGAGHAFHWERIDDINPRVLDWLKAH